MNCDCCPMSLLVVRSQWFSWTQVDRIVINFHKGHESLGLSLSLLLLLSLSSSLSLQLSFCWSSHVFSEQMSQRSRVSKIALLFLYWSHNLPEMNLKPLDASSRSGRSRRGGSRYWTWHLSSFFFSKYFYSSSSSPSNQANLAPLPSSLTSSPAYRTLQSPNVNWEIQRFRA